MKWRHLAQRYIFEWSTLIKQKNISTIINSITMAIIIMVMGKRVHTRHKVIYRTESFGTFRPTDGALMMIIHISHEDVDEDAIYCEPMPGIDKFKCRHQSRAENAH